MRRNIITLFALLFSLFTYAESVHNVRMTVTPYTDNTTHETTYDTCHYYYNDKNQVVWEQASGIRYVYQYNAAGQRIRRDGYSWVEADMAYRYLGYKEYEYNDGGTLKEDRTYTEKWNQTGVYDCKRYEYTSYDGDVATAYSYYFNGVLFYNYKVDVTKKNGRISKKVVKESDPDKLIQSWSTVSTEEYTYQTNGDIKTVKSTVGSNDPVVTTYYYSDFDPQYAPKNLKATVNGSVVHLTWDAVAGASGYVITFDQQHVPVTTNSADVHVKVGTHDFTVRSVVNGEERNASETATATIIDNSRMPAYNLTAGSAYKTLEKPDAGDMREFYNIPLSWSLPQSDTPINDIIVYYDSKTYGNDFPIRVQNPSATNFVLRVAPFEVSNWDADGNPVTGADTPVYVVIEYTTGMSEKSNIIYINPFDVITGVRPVAVEAQPSNAAAYNVAGQSVGAEYKGIVIKNGKKTIKK